MPITHLIDAPGEQWLQEAGLGSDFAHGTVYLPTTDLIYLLEACVEAETEFPAHSIAHFRNRFYHRVYEMYDLAPSPENHLRILANRNLSDVHDVDVPEAILRLIGSDQAREKVSRLIARRREIVESIREIEEQAARSFGGAKMTLEAFDHDEGDPSLTLLIKAYGDLASFWSSYEAFTDWLLDHEYDDDPDLGVLPLYAGSETSEEEPR